MSSGYVGLVAFVQGLTTLLAQAGQVTGRHDTLLFQAYVNDGPIWSHRKDDSLSDLPSAGLREVELPFQVVGHGKGGFLWLL